MRPVLFPRLPDLGISAQETTEQRLIVPNGHLCPKQCVLITAKIPAEDRADARMTTKRHLCRYCGEAESFAFC